MYVCVCADAHSHLVQLNCQSKSGHPVSICGYIRSVHALYVYISIASGYLYRFYFFILLFLIENQLPLPLEGKCRLITITAGQVHLVLFVSSQHDLNKNAARIVVCPISFRLINSIDLRSDQPTVFVLRTLSR